MSGGLFDVAPPARPLFYRKELLRPSHVPSHLPHREEQIRQVASALRDSATRGEPANVLVHGKPGTGKTAVALHVLRSLPEGGPAGGRKCTPAYINCQQVSTPYGIYAHLARALGATVPPTGLAVERVFQRFREALDREARCMVAVLDELDMAADRDGGVLYNLSRLNGELERSAVAIVGISNDVNFTRRLDARVRSSLGEVPVVFPPYDAPQLFDILMARVREGLAPGAVDEGAVRLCAAVAASESGDARWALDLLRVTVEIAEEEGAERAGEAHLRSAQVRLKRDCLADVVRSLPPHARIFLLAQVERNGTHTVTTGTALELYEKCCRRHGIEPVGLRSVQDYIGQLDLLGVVRAPVVQGRTGGRTREIRLNIASYELRKILLEDGDLREFLTGQPRFQARLPMTAAGAASEATPPGASPPSPPSRPD
ncbi:MAG: AAA family ATPase, partial [Halobacteria archaeon]